MAFEIIGDDYHLPLGCTKSSGHLIFDINMDFTRKAIWVKDGHCTTYPKTSKYAGVVSIERICILLTHAALNLTPLNAEYIRSVYLQYPTSENHYIFCVPEFELDNVGKRAKIL